MKAFLQLESIYPEHPNFEQYRQVLAGQRVEGE